jgi:hypothetical protein
MIVATNWPPYTPAELPPAVAGDLESILEPLYVATLELHRTLYRYELLRALGRDSEFVERINGTSAAPSLNTVKGCINTAIVASLCCFFDEDASAVNLRTILNRVLRPEYAERFCEFHASVDPSFDVRWQIGRLQRMQRRLKPGGSAGKAIERLSHLRNQMVAHLDRRPAFDRGYPVMADMSVVLAAVANVMVSTVRLTIPGRRIMPAWGRRDAQLQARALCLAIHPVESASAGFLHLVSGAPK